MIRKLLAVPVFLFWLTAAFGAEGGWQAEWKKTLVAAQQEGKLTLIGPPAAGHRQAVMKFQEAFPAIRLEYAGIANLEQYVLRLTQERQTGQYLWDVFVCGFYEPMFSKQIPAGWFDPVRPMFILPDILDDRKWGMGPRGRSGFEAGFGDKAKKYAYAFALSVGSTGHINGDMESPAAIRKLADLLDPRWKGKIAWLDPRMGRISTNVIALFRMRLGDEAARKMLVDQQPVFTQDDRQLTEWLVRGRYPIGIGVSSTVLATFQKEGLGKNIQRLGVEVETASPGWGALFLVNRAPHPNAAKVFLNWMLGQQAQAAWAQMGRANSRRVDVPSGDPATLPDSKAWDRYVILDTEENVRHRGEAAEFSRKVLK